MSTVKGTVIWPGGIRQDVKDLIDLYFALVDSKDSTAGARLADEVFATDGKWFAAAGCFEGHDSISASREKAWDVVQSQSHEIVKVFFNDTTHSPDLLLAGMADIELKSSERIRREFLVRAVLSSDNGLLRIKFWQPMLSKPSPSEQPILVNVEM